MSYSHAHFLANVRDPWLTEAWAEARADAENARDGGEAVREGRGAVGGSTVPRPHTGGAA